MSLKESHNRETQRRIDEKRGKIEVVQEELEVLDKKEMSLQKELLAVQSEIKTKVIQKIDWEKAIENLTATFWVDSK